MTDRTQKENFLKQHGWYQWYNPNYWCHEQFASNGRDPTRWGMSLEEAYDFETDEASRNKTLEGMTLFGSAMNALSNLKDISK